ncbi:MAG TPA: autotransporter-associated beta strand repeat-containing protein, partial [Phycisphaerae bacterium]|nr:autotransporter-associated beta strand repeat-containing protein [Phycisphaerae bacterium]
FSTDSSTTGTVVVSNANTYTGPTTISGGILSTNLLANGGVASGIGMSSNDAANLVLNGGTLQYTGPAVTIDRNFSLPQGSSSGGTLDASGTGALTITGNVTGGTTGTKYLYLTGTNTDANTLSGAIADGSGSTTRLYKTGTGTWALSGNNTYSNSTNVNEGVLLLNSANALPGGIGSSGGTSALLINGGVVGLGHGDFSRDVGTGVDEVRFSGSGGFAAYGADRAVNLGGAGATVTWNVGYFLPTDSSLILGAATADHMVDFQNPINLTGGDRTIQVNNGSAAVDAKISGEISGTAGIGNVVKTGDGTLLLTANNTYTGTTTISAGTLLVDGSLADSAVSVNGGVLGGSGVVNGSVVVASGANLAPGNSPGSLELGSALNLQSGSTLVIELGGTTFTLNGTEQYDRVKVTGATTLAGALNVSLIDAFTPNAGDLFGIVDATGGLTGTFGNYAEGDTVLTSGGVIVKITYLGNVTDSTVSQTGGSDVVLYAVPEPASMALLLLGGGLALLRRRR